MRKVWTMAGVAVLVAWGGGLLDAAKWGPNGHPELTYDAAQRAEFGVPSDVGKVMALGSVAPDYLEFDNPAAHAQTPDPFLTQDNHVGVSPAKYKQTQQDAFEKSESWHELYMEASVREMKAGHRERAAFLLGYAMHNAVDFPTHMGMPNSMHASLVAHGNDPDMDFKRLAAAHEMVSLDLTRFRKEVGADNWKLFRGEAVRGPGIGSIVPEPLLQFGTDLEKWDPRSGVIAPTARDETLKALVDSKLDKYLGTQLYELDIRGRMHETKRVEIENFIFGLHARLEKMLPIVRGANPDLPDPPGVVAYADKLKEFGGLAKQYDALSPEDKRLLGELRWKEMLEEELAALRQERERYRQGRWAQSLKRQSSLELVRWAENQRGVCAEVNAGPPTVDARPVYSSVPSSSYTTSGYSGGSDRGRPGPSGGGGGEITGYSPTFNGLRGGKIGW